MWSDETMSLYDDKELQVQPDQSAQELEPEPEDNKINQNVIACIFSRTLTESEKKHLELFETSVSIVQDQKTRHVYLIFDFSPNEPFENQCFQKMIQHQNQDQMMNLKMLLGNKCPSLYHHLPVSCITISTHLTCLWQKKQQ